MFFQILVTNWRQNFLLQVYISNFISMLYNHIAINLEDIDKTYANKD